MILLLALWGGADPGGGSRLQVFRQGIQGAVPKDGGDPAAKGYARAVKELSFKKYSEMFMAV